MRDTIIGNESQEIDEALTPFRGTNIDIDVIEKQNDALAASNQTLDSLKQMQIQSQSQPQPQQQQKRRVSTKDHELISSTRSSGEKSFNDLPQDSVSTGVQADMTRGSSFNSISKHPATHSLDKGFASRSIGNGPKEEEKHVEPSNPLRASSRSFSPFHVHNNVERTAESSSNVNGDPALIFDSSGVIGEVISTGQKRDHNATMGSTIAVQESLQKRQKVASLDPASPTTTSLINSSSLQTSSLQGSNSGNFPMTESIAVPVPKTLDAANGSGLVEPVQQSKEQHRAKSQFSETAPDIASTYKTPIDKSTSVSPSSTANQPQTSWQEQRQWQAQSQRGAHTSGRKSSTPSMASMSKRTIVTDMYRPKVSLGSARENGKDQMASLNPISDKGYKSAPKKPLVIKGRIKHPHLAAVYSMHQLASDLAKEKRTSLKVSYFLQQSSHFISAAHEHLARFKQNYNWENYHKLVKAALRCLMLLWRKYEKDMTPRQRIVVCYRIAEIYLNETESFEVAEKYINMAIKICKSEELVEQEFYCDLLLIKVLEKTNVAVAIEHVEMKISEYGEKKIGGCQLFAECLTLIRVHYSLVDDFPVASIKLQRLVKGKQLHPSLHILASIYQAGLLIHRGDPVRAITILKEVDQVQLGSSHPFKAYLLLTTMLALLTSNDIPGAKRVLNELAFVRDESKKTNWDQWSANGETKIKIKIKVDEKEDQLTFSFPWLLKSEFLAITYFYSGLIYLNDRRTNARDYFKKALISTKEDLNSNRLAPMRFLRDRLVKSKTFRSFIQLYQQYYAFGMDDYRALYIKDLVTLNNKGIPRFEYLYLKPQLPITNYIFALYCHRKGDLQAAKYYYALVRNMTIDVDKNTDNLESLNQLTSGVECDSCRPQGKFNELYIYSSLQLVVLLDYEARELERRQGRTNSESATAWRNGIADELRAATLTEHGSDLFQYNFLSKNRLVLFTISIVLQLLNDADPNFFDSGEDVHSVLASLGEKPAFYLIHFLLSFALSAQMGASKDQEKAFEKALSVLPSSKSEPLRENGSYSASTSEVADSCRVMILRALHKNLTSNSDLGRAETNDLQQQRLCKLLSPSYNFLAKNVVVEGAEMKG